MLPDVIVVGGGSAGCVIAGRLSENPRLQVLLLEAGPPSGGLFSRIPAAFNRLFRGPCDWAFETAPEPRLDGRRLYWPRGRMLGGSSAMNAMIWTPGHATDFDAWEAQGCTGWGWRDVAPWFERIALVPEILPRHNPITDAFVAAAQGTGVPRNDGFRGGNMLGAGYFATSIHGGERNSAERAYLQPARSRPNLTIRTRVLVDRVVFQGTRATGVAVRAGGRQETIRAGAVVLATGAIGSPVVLMRSGVGPADELKRLGITPIANAPGVGQNLSDHLACGIAVRSLQPVTLEGAKGPGALLQWLLTKSGPLTSNIAEAGAFYQLKADSPAPDLELLVGPAWFVDHGFGEFAGHGFTLAAIGLGPKSRGRIRLGGARPEDAPAIEANYLDDPADLAVLVEGLRRCREIAGSPALRAFSGEEVLPGASEDSDAALAAHIRQVAQTLYHPAGTCRMGKDASAVVDPELRVLGVEGLWVADGSVMPTLVSAHPNAAAMMIGERAADFVSRTV